MFLTSLLARRIPDLKLRLLQARMPDTPEQYVAKSLNGAFVFSFALAMIALLFTKSPIALLLAVLLTPLLFLYFLKYVDMRVLQQQRAIGQEIVFAGRFLLIELESDVPLFSAFQNLAHNYKNIGQYFQEIVDKVNLGTSLEDALAEALETSPSDDLRNLLWQTLNSIKTGASIHDSMSVAIEQIVREQHILVEEYGRKLSPLAMFYMMMAVIAPSLGVAILIVIATFIGLRLRLPVLLTMAGGIGFMQFMFLAIIRSSRPPVDFD